MFTRTESGKINLLKKCNRISHENNNKLSKYFHIITSNKTNLPFRLNLSKRQNSIKIFVKWNLNAFKYLQHNAIQNIFCVIYILFMWYIIFLKLHYKYLYNDHFVNSASVNPRFFCKKVNQFFFPKKLSLETEMMGYLHERKN